MAKVSKFSFSLYFVLYVLLVLAEFIFVLLMWSPYGDPDGPFGKLYDWVRERLNSFMIASLFILTFTSYFFPGVGVFVLLILMYRIAEKCCKKKENYNNLDFDKSNIDTKTVFDQGYLDRTTNSSFSSADGDQKDPYFLFPLDSENWIIPKIIDQVDVPKECSLKYVGSVFQDSIKPRGLYTTSLLSKQLHER